MRFTCVAEPHIVWGVRAGGPRLPPNALLHIVYLSRWMGRSNQAASLERVIHSLGHRQPGTAQRDHVLETASGSFTAAVSSHAVHAHRD